jgi:hypothetical protein
MSGEELIDAMKFHYPVYVQNSFAEAQLKSVQNAIDFLKRFEVIDARQVQRKSHASTSNRDHHNGRDYGTGRGNNNNLNRHDNRPRQLSHNTGVLPA